VAREMSVPCFLQSDQAVSDAVPELELYSLKDLLLLRLRLVDELPDDVGEHAVGPGLGLPTVHSSRVMRSLTSTGFSDFGELHLGASDSSGNFACAVWKTLVEHCAFFDRHVCISRVSLDGTLSDFWVLYAAPPASLHILRRAFGLLIRRISFDRFPGFAVLYIGFCTAVVACDAACLLW
jgi:hypothetical protein